MNNKDYISRLSQISGYTQTDTQQMVRTVIEQVSHALEGGDVVQIAGFGSFEVRKRLERIAINPSTQQRMLVPPKLVVNFRPIALIKENLKKTANGE